MVVLKNFFVLLLILQLRMSSASLEKFDKFLQEERDFENLLTEISSAEHRIRVSN